MDVCLGVVEVMQMLTTAQIKELKCQLRVTDNQSGTFDYRPQIEMQIITSSSTLHKWALAQFTLCYLSTFRRVAEPNIGE